MLAGCRSGKKLIVDTWVMSFRAFSRHIEYKCLEELFARFDVDEIELDYLSTGRNGPFCEFLGEILGEVPETRCNISREALGARLGSLREPQEATNG